MIYALGIGFSQGKIKYKIDPLKEKDMKYTNETDSEFSVFPIAAVNAPLEGLMHFIAVN